MGSCGGCASAGERCGNGLEKIYPTTAIRYGLMRHIGEFSHPPSMRFSCGGKVVISTDRGIEIGDQVSLTCFGCDKSVTRDQMRGYAEASGGDAYRLKAGRILREATEEDLKELRHLEDGIFEKLKLCREMVTEFDLDMKIVDCEHIFGGERIVFYFMAEGRVDFRELVRRMAGEYQTRIEMRQIGARDEARLVADYETCGRECCCKSFLKTLKPVSMSMAKLQMTTLDLSKVSGRCGRLKCCLRYEHEGYESLDKKLPRFGSRIATAHGTGRVVDRQVLTQLVKIQTDDNTYVSVVVEDILERDLPNPEVPDSAQRESREPRDRRRERPNAREPGPAPAQRPPQREPGPVERPGSVPPEAEAHGESNADPNGDRQSRGRRGRRGRRRHPDDPNRGAGPPASGPTPEP